MATVASSAKVFAITMPPELARKAEYLAAQDGITVSDLLIEAFQAYFVDGARRPLADIADYAAKHNPHGYVEADIPRLIEEVRAARAPEAGRVLAQASVID
jgi:hypothetical protein